MDCVMIARIVSSATQFRLNKKGLDIGYGLWYTNSVGMVKERLRPLRKLLDWITIATLSPTKYWLSNAGGKMT